MRRNKTLMYLARELESCNEQRLVCEQIFVHCCRSVNELADNSIRMVQQQLDKPEIKSCRIPLEIDYEKMTDPDYWLKRELFSTPFKDRSEPLGQKIVRLVNMLRALKLKIQEVDTDYAEKVFKRMAARQKKSTNIFDYEIWRKRHPHPTMKQLEEQHIALYEYDVQLKMIHEDMVRLMPELAEYLYDNKNLASLENTKLFAPYLHIKEMLKGEWFRKLRIDTKYNDKWADAFAEALIRSEYGSHIADDWKVKDYKIKGYVIGCLKEAGVFMANVSNDSIAKDAAIISKTRTFGKYIGADSQKQPYAEWIRKHVDDYCK